MVTAIKIARFTILRQINAITCIKKDLNEKQTDFEKTFKLLANQYPQYSNLKIDIKELIFFIEKGEVDLLQDLDIEQERFEVTLIAINKRNKHYLTYVEPAVHAHVPSEENTLKGKSEEDVYSHDVDHSFSSMLITYSHPY